MYSKKDLKNFLEEISPCAKFTRFDYASPEKFRIELRCQAEQDQNMEFYVEMAKKWIIKFSKFTATTWIVLHSFLKLKRLVFRKIYTCNRSSHNKRMKMNNETRNQECKAKIDFKIKITNRNTMKNDKLLKEGLNLNILIDFVHSHKVLAPESFHLLRNVPETEGIFQKYFETGCSAGVVKSYHELTLTDKYGENCPEVFENAIMNPTLRNLIYLQDKIKRKKMLNVTSTRQAIEEKIASLKESDVDVVLSETDMSTFLIVTPLMKRIIKEIGLEYVLVDSTDVLSGPTTTFILVPTNIGAFPVACILHDKYALAQGLELAKSHLETSNQVQFYPKISIINFEDSQMLPSVRVFISRYSLCSEVWRWLNDDENKVERKKRHLTMLSIKLFIYAENLQAAEKLYSELQELVEPDSNFKEYLTGLWEKKEQWMIFEDHNLNNSLVEMSIRFLKEFLQRKCKSFVEPIMVDLVTEILENHFKRILASYVKKSKTVATYTKFLTKSKIVLSFGSEVRRISANEFRVDGQSKQKYRYIYFRTDTMCCDCTQGKKGNFCEHLTAIVNVIDCEVMQAPVITEEERELYIKITGGDVKDEIKPEFSEDVKNFNDFDKHSDDLNEEMYLQIDEELQSGASSPKVERYNEFHIEVKTEKCDSFDPLDEEIEGEQDQTELVISENISDVIPTTSKNSDMKRTYEVTLKAVNDEFRRLNRFFSENPNASNLETMKRLARELAKIRPVKKVNLDNMFLKLNNKNKKRKRES